MNPFDPTTDLRVLIACEDSAAAGQACAVLECLGRNCEPDGRLIYQWWNFEVLAITLLREMASREAAAADLVVIAVHGQGKLPRAVNAWITQWLNLRKGRRGALVALLDSDSKDSDDPTRLILQLKKSAALGQMDFFVNRSHGEAETGDDTRFGDAARQFVMASIRRPNLNCRAEEATLATNGTTFHDRSWRQH